MPLIRFDAVSLRFGAQPILREAEFSIEAGERVCLVGRNGAGKTSLLKLITGEIAPDSGEVNIPSTIGVSQLAQVLPRELDQKVGEFVADGLRAGNTAREHSIRSIQRVCENYNSCKIRLRRTVDGMSISRSTLCAPKWVCRSTVSWINCPVDGAGECVLLRHWCRVLICYSWMSQPITSTSIPSNGWNAV